MTTVNEAVSNNKPPLGAELAAGISFLSANQQITFTLYKKMILPFDGFIFWVNYNLVTPNVGDPPISTTIQGSLHYSTEIEQEEDSTLSVNTIIFTALTPCDIFNLVNPQFLYIASYRGIRFAFSSQGKYYQQADLWHYYGVAITAKRDTQIIDNAAQLGSLKQIVSNSLPIWLAMPSYIPPYPGFTCPITLYPSFLVPENWPAPYGIVHIEDTKSLVESAFLGRTLTSSQLATETVKIITYGVNNDNIITFLNFVLQYSADWNYIGLANMPIISDEKEPSVELQTISQRKTIEFKINYLQESVRNVARQFILKALCDVGSSIAWINPSPYIIIGKLKLTQVNQTILATG